MPAPIVSPSRRRKWSLRALLSGLVLLGLLLAAFAVNGLVLRTGRTPVLGATGAPEAEALRSGDEVRIVAWNLAKLFLHRGGLDFDEPRNVRERLARAAEHIAAAKPDLVFLSEIVTECALCPVDQVRELAERLGMPHYAFGENYCFGLPLLRIVGGNAILARWPLEPTGNPDLPGRRPFWVTRNNRRLLLCSIRVAGVPTTLASLHLDSFDLENNARQVRFLLQRTRGGPTLLAGDLNAEPETASIRLLRASGRFLGTGDPTPTFPTKNPRRRIDDIYAPARWQLVESRVLEPSVSDHRAVLAVFRIR